MVLGSFTEADRRLRLYEAQMRLLKRQKIDKAMWEKYEDDFEDEMPVIRGTGTRSADKKDGNK